MSTRRHRRPVVLCAVLGVLAGAGAGALLPDQAVARAEIAVSSDAGSVDLLSRRVASYADLAAGPLVLAPVIADLGLDTSPSDLAGHVEAEVPDGTLLLTVSARARTGPEAARLADAVADQLVETVVSLETGPDAVSARTLVDAAVAPSPLVPRPVLLTGLGLLLGLAAGVALAWWRERSDTTIRTADDLLAMTAPTLMGSIPDDPGHLVPSVLESQGARAEAFRRLRTQLQFVDVDHPPQAIVVTSSIPGEGRTTVAVNLAVSLARNGRKVVLIDVDLRHPRVHTQLGLRGQQGLTRLLSGQATLNEVLQEVGTDGLQVLPAGPVPANPSELLGSKNMLNLLQTLDQVFDHIILDAPPVLSVTDAAVLSKITNGVLLVVRADYVRREELEEALQHLSQVRSRVLGTVLTMVPGSGRTGRPGIATDPVTLTVPAPATAAAPTVEYSVSDSGPTEPAEPARIPVQKAPEVPVVNVTSLGNPDL